MNRSTIQSFSRFDILTVVGAMFDRRLAEDENDLLRFLSFVIGTVIKPEEIDCAMEFCHPHLMGTVRNWTRWGVNVKSVFKHVDRYRSSNHPEDEESAVELIIGLREHIQAADNKGQKIGNMDAAQKRWRTFKKQCMKNSST